MDIFKTLSEEFGIKQEYVENIVELIDDDNTIPFIARYRKERTGACDDQVLRALHDRLLYLRNLEKRREEIIVSITEQEQMTKALEKDIAEATTLARLEDIYRPYKPKRRTRATVAKEKGLQPLAEILFGQAVKEGDIYALAQEYVNEEKEVLSAEDALSGAMDIVAEWVSDSADARAFLRESIKKAAILSSQQAKEEDSVYSMYYEYGEPVGKVPPHRILAINRGEKEGFLKVSIKANDDRMLGCLYNMFITGDSVGKKALEEAVTDAYKRLIFPALEREVRAELTEMASEQAIKIFGLNLGQLLLQPPIKGKVTLGLDPAYRTGCKIAVVDATGKVLDTTVIYPTPPQNKTEEAKAKLKALIKKHGVNAISIGNGTASKESEIFVADLIREIEEDVSYMVVSEAGASVYSASKLGAEEFPSFDVSLRSAISIARRMQDPLAELVKIDPKSIGVGQYQHDVPQKRLDETLRGVVEDCVNRVGVELNTASASLLAHVSGLSSSVAQNIVAYREENGAFTSRQGLKKVKKLGPKAYEQCAGFLRISGAENVLDNTGVHPESYPAAKKILEIFSYTDKDVREGNLTSLHRRVKEEGESNIAEKCKIGVPTLRDIVGELMKPGRDVRDDMPQPLLRTDVMDMKDLKEGMELTGTIRNVVDFGVFVDIGVHEDGLVHISQIADRFIRHPSEVVSVGDRVTVWVLGVDTNKKRISLTMKKPAK